jgi:hypothetical protein
VFYWRNVLFRGPYIQYASKYYCRTIWRFYIKIKNTIHSTRVGLYLQRYRHFDGASFILWKEIAICNIRSWNVWKIWTFLGLVLRRWKISICWRLKIVFALLLVDSNWWAVVQRKVKLSMIENCKILRREILRFVYQWKGVSWGEIKVAFVFNQGYSAGPWAGC